MNINVLTIFPEIFDIFENGVISKAIKKRLLLLNVLDIRKNSINKHFHVDSKPYGGGEGMVMRAEPIVRTLSEINNLKDNLVIYLSPQGKKLNQKKVIHLSKLKDITLICGRYEGIDQRVIDKYVDEEISVGDFVLSGGEYAALCIIDAIARHIPGTLGNQESYKKDTQVVFVNSSNDEVLRPRVNGTDMKGISDPNDDLKFDMVINDGPKEYIEWFKHLASNF